MYKIVRVVRLLFIMEKASTFILFNRNILLYYLKINEEFFEMFSTFFRTKNTIFIETIPLNDDSSPQKSNKQWLIGLNKKLYKI